MAAKSSPAKSKDPRFPIAITPEILMKELDPFVERVTSLQEDTNDNYEEDLSVVEEDLKSAYHYTVIDSSGETIDFTEDINRRCYVFHYAMGHIVCTSTILNKLLLRECECFCPSYSMWVKRHAGMSLKICSIGGGPGTDVFALQGHLKWLVNEMKERENEYEVPVINDVCILDKCCDWKDMYKYLYSSLELPAANYVKFDFKTVLTGEDKGEWKQHLQNADVITMSKFATAVMVRTKPEQVLQAQSRLAALISQMKQDALLLYVDTDHSFYAGKAAKVFRDAKLGKLFEKSFECDVTGFEFGGAKPTRRILLLVQVWCR